MSLLKKVHIEAYKGYELRIMNTNVTPSLEEYLTRVHNIEPLYISFIGIDENDYFFKKSESDSIIFQSSFKKIEQDKGGSDIMSLMMKFMKSKSDGRDDIKTVSDLLGKYIIRMADFDSFNQEPINNILTDKSKNAIEKFISEREDLKDFDRENITKMIFKASDTVKDAIKNLSIENLQRFFIERRSSLTANEIELLEIYLLSSRRLPVLETITGKKYDKYNITGSENLIFPCNLDVWYFIFGISGNKSEIIDNLKEIVDVLYSYNNEKVILEQRYDNLLLDEKYELLPDIKTKIDAYNK